MTKFHAAVKIRIKPPGRRRREKMIYYNGVEAKNGKEAEKIIRAKALASTSYVEQVVDVRMNAR